MSGGPYQPPDQPQYQQGYQPAGSYPPGQYPPYQSMPPMPAPTSSKATTSLVLGVVSLLMCGFVLGIPAMIVGRQAKREIQQSQGRLGGEGLATAGFVTGLIATILSGLAALAVIGLVVFGGLFLASHDCTTTTDSDGYSTFDCT